MLQNPKVKVELTATAHAGFHKYSFSGSQPVSLNFDLFRGIANDPVGDTLDGVVAVKNRELSGYRRSKGWAADKTCYFVAEFSRPFDSVGITVDGKPFDFGSRTSPAAIPSRRKFEGSEEMVVKGVRVTAGVGFTNPKEPILVKVGISGVSVEAARKNLAAEIPAWDFQGTVAAAAASWNNMLGRVEIEAIDPATRQVFYTALYHAAMAPTLYNDADGSYRGLDHKVHEAEGFQNYCTFSLWDTFRAEHALLTIVQPQRVDDFIGTMLAHYRQFGQHALPVWSLAGNETWCMIGNHAVPVIAEAYAKGFRRYDVEAVYQAMRDALMQDRNLMARVPRQGLCPVQQRHDHAAGRAEPIGLANAGVCLRRLVPGPHGPTAGQDRRRQALSCPLGELPQRIRPGAWDSCAASCPTASGASRSAPTSSSGPIIPRPRPGSTVSSCRRTCRRWSG